MYRAFDWSVTLRSPAVEKMFSLLDAARRSCDIAIVPCVPLTYDNNSMVPLLVCLLFLLVTPLPAAHRPLLPRPQQVQYGNGKFALKGTTISFGSSPAPEDRFAANELASVLAEITAGPVPAVNSGTAAGGIVLYRTGAVDAMPGPDDRPGPDSRESYTLHISDSRAEIRARSSAGLYYAAQTIRQLVEDVAGEKFLPEVDIRDWPAPSPTAVS